MIALEVAPEDPAWAVQLMLFGFSDKRVRSPAHNFVYVLLSTRWVGPSHQQIRDRQLPVAATPMRSTLVSSVAWKKAIALATLLNQKT